PRRFILPGASCWDWGSLAPCGWPGTISSSAGSRRQPWRAGDGAAMMHGWRGNLLAVGRGAAPFALILIAWALVTRANVLPAIFLPPPADVARTGWDMLKDGSLWTNIGASVGRVLVSLVISVPLAV